MREGQKEWRRVSRREARKNTQQHACRWALAVEAEKVEAEKLAGRSVEIHSFLGQLGQLLVSGALFVERLL